MEGVTACAALQGMKGAVKQTPWVTGLFAKAANGLENKLSMKARVQSVCHPSFIFRYVLTLRVNIASQHVAKRLDLYLRVDTACQLAMSTLRVNSQCQHVSKGLYALLRVDTAC